jgi:N-acyl amino acid synthase FeeM
VIFRATRSPKPQLTYDTTWLDSLLEESRKATAHASKTECRTRVATRPEQLEAAADLVRKRYASRGYQVNGVQRARPASSTERVTLLAEDRGALVGTLTVRPDSMPGLLAEMSYSAEIEGLRRKGHVLGEVVKLAVEEGGNSRTALDALVRSAYVISHVVHARSHVVIEVNPRHVRFYERALGFVVAAAERMCSRVGAPSVLMELDLDQFGRRLQSTAGKVRPALEVVS